MSQPIVVLKGFSCRSCFQREAEPVEVKAHDVILQEIGHAFGKDWQRSNLLCGPCKELKRTVDQIWLDAQDPEERKQMEEFIARRAGEKAAEELDRTLDKEMRRAKDEIVTKMEQEFESDCDYFHDEPELE